MAPPTHTEQELLDPYRGLAEDLGALPRAVDVRRADGPGWNLYLRLFNRIETVRIGSGAVVHPSDIDPGADLIRERRGSYEQPELEEHLRALHRDLGRLPGEIDLQEAPGPSYQSYYRRYGGMIQAYDAAGLLKFDLRA